MSFDNTYKNKQAKIVALREAHRLARFLENTLRDIDLEYSSKDSDFSHENEQRFRKVRIQAIDLTRAIELVYSWAASDIQKEQTTK